MEPLSPPRFQSGGGYKVYSSPTTIYNDSSQNDNCYKDEQGHSPLAPTSPSRWNQQQLAQRMMKSSYEDGPSNYNNNHGHHIRSPRDHYSLGHDDPTNAELLPPWETTTSKGDYVRRCAERAMHRRNYKLPPPSHNDTNLNSNNNPMKENDPLLSQVLPDLSTIPQSPPRSTKSVSFNTRDKIHQWDDQLDQLKHVDEAFFAAAKYLLEDIHNAVVNDYYLEKEEDDFRRLHHYLQGDDEVRRNNNSGGILAKLFQCGNLRDVGETNHQKPYLGVDGEVLDDGKGAIQPKEKKFKLTEKLIKDFETAVRFRMENLEGDIQTPTDQTEDKAVKTKEIARKIEAYGLPKIWKNEAQVKEELNATAVSLNEESTIPIQQEKKLQEQQQTRFFPLLPMKNDENETDVPVVDGSHHNTGNSNHNNAKASNSNFLSKLSSLFKIKSTPTQEECHKNLQRIGLEISKVQQMIEATRNTAVQSACTQRMAKLNYEKRFYQIIKEQYKIRQMEKDTKTGSVKFACQERLKQLMQELESLNLKKEELDVKIPANETNNNWYEKATQYVNATHNDLVPQQQQTSQECNSCHHHPHYEQQANHMTQHQSLYQQHPKECQRDLYRPDSYQHTTPSSAMHQQTHYGPPQHEVMYSPVYSQQQIHSASPSTHHCQYAYNSQTHNIHNDSKNNLQPKPGQRLPLAKPIPKQEGLNKFISYIAP